MQHRASLPVIAAAFLVVMDLRRYRRIWPEGEVACRRNRFPHLSTTGIHGTGAQLHAPIRFGNGNRPNFDQRHALFLDSELLRDTWCYVHDAAWRIRSTVLYC